MVVSASAEGEKTSADEAMVERGTASLWSGVRNDAADERNDEEPPREEGEGRAEEVVPRRLVGEEDEGDEKGLAAAFWRSRRDSCR